MKNFNKFDKLVSPTTRAFIGVSLFVIIILILVWPPATWALLQLANVLPGVLLAITAFITTMHLKK